MLRAGSQDDRDDATMLIRDGRILGFSPPLVRPVAYANWPQGGLAPSWCNLLREDTP